MSKFKTGQLIHLKGDPKEVIFIIHVGIDKYFVRFPQGTENIIKIESTDKHYQLKEAVPCKCGCGRFQ